MRLPDRQRERDGRRLHRRGEDAGLPDTASHILPARAPRQGNRPAVHVARHGGSARARGSAAPAGAEGEPAGVCSVPAAGNAPNRRNRQPQPDGVASLKQPTAAFASGYRPDIDGLRAIAVLAVVVFHTYSGSLTGGYTGVDVFFVISGYLITGLLVKDLAEGSFSLRKFYGRRIRRIFPALAV